jgi:hypothetical protein
VVIKRYAEVRDKFPREVVLLRSVGCAWGKCAFCDYKDDAEPDAARCVAFNRDILSHVTGSCNAALQIIDSASFNELPAGTVFDIIETCISRHIRLVIMEQHWRYRDSFSAIRKTFAAFGIECKFIVGLESFDNDFRERVLKKGIGSISDDEATQYFQWANLLCGVQGQTFEMIQNDIEKSLRYFERMTVNMFIPNSTSFKRDDALVDAFYRSPLFAAIRDNSAVEILDILDERAPDFLGGIGYPEKEKIVRGARD